MQEAAAKAYSETAKVASTPRQLEASLLLKAASQLQEISDKARTDSEALDNALLYNRRLWTIFVSSVSDTENDLPHDIKNNIVSLGAFIFSHTLEIQAHPTPEKLKTLININKEIAAGLHAGA